MSVSTQFSSLQCPDDKYNLVSEGAWFLASYRVVIRLPTVWLALYTTWNMALVNLVYDCRSLHRVHQIYSLNNNKKSAWVRGTAGHTASGIWTFLSASLYFSKRGAYWDRLCRDVVGRCLVGWLVGWLVVTRVHCGQTVRPRPIVTMEH